MEQLNVRKKPDVFTLLKDGDSALETLEKLQAVGVKRFALFDELGASINEIQPSKELIALVVPMIAETDEAGKVTRKYLEKMEMTRKAKYFLLDLVNCVGEKELDEGIVRYYPHKNLIVLKANMFADEKIFGLALENIKKLEPKCVNIDELALVKMLDEWKKKAEFNEVKTKENLTSVKEDLVTHKNSFIHCLSSIKEIEASLETIKRLKESDVEVLKSQIKEVRELPVVKSISYDKDGIHIRYGAIFITGDVQVAVDVTGEIQKPVIEKKKVYIGDMEFVIGSTIRLINHDNPLGERYQHPHADEGKVCLGEGELDVYSMVDSMRLSALAKYLYSWLISYNSGDCYRTLKEFYDGEEDSSRGD